MQALNTASAYCLFISVSLLDIGQIFHLSQIIMQFRVMYKSSGRLTNHTTDNFLHQTAIPHNKSPEKQECEADKMQNTTHAFFPARPARDNIVSRYTE
jgi:hypothetical protein